MKNTAIKSINHAIIAALFIVPIFTVFPALAQAQYYGSNRYYSARPVYTYDTYRYNPAPITYPVYYPVYYPSYPAIQASCYANTTSVHAGESVTWYASVSGGNGSYSYSWSGTDGLYGYGSSIYKNYYNAGAKSASVNITSGSQTASINCGNYVSVYDNSYYYSQQTYPYYQAAVVQYQNYPAYNGASGLDIGCFADPSSASINQPITWSTEITGGLAPYTYSWTGSDGLNGSQSSVIKYYGTSGEKNAIVSVTSADGKTGTRACTNSVTVRSAAIRTPTPTQVQTQPQPVQQQNQPANTSLSAASLFSLSNVPWGWVAILIILVLFATVMYLLFNRPKI
jgi:hypothetical protein